MHRRRSLALSALALFALVAASGWANVNYLTQSAEPTIAKVGPGKVRIAFGLCPSPDFGRKRFLELEEAPQPEPDPRCLDEMTEWNGSASPMIALLLLDGSSVPDSFASTAGRAVTLERYPEGDAEAAEGQPAPAGYSWRVWRTSEPFVAEAKPDVADFEVDVQLPPLASGAPFSGTIRWAVVHGDPHVDVYERECNIAAAYAEINIEMPPCMLFEHEQEENWEPESACIEEMRQPPASSTATSSSPASASSRSRPTRWSSRRRPRPRPLPRCRASHPPPPWWRSTSRSTFRRCSTWTRTAWRSSGSAAPTRSRAASASCGCPPPTAAPTRSGPAPRRPAPWSSVGQLGRWTLNGGKRTQFTLKFGKTTRSALTRRQVGATVRLHANDGNGHRFVGKRKIILR